MNFTGWAVKNLAPVLFLTTVLALAGAAVYASFPVSILPDVTFPRVVAIADAGDRPTQAVEVSVTRPIEDSLAQIPNVKRVKSQTKRGSTEISVDFQDGTDILQAEQLVNAKVNQVRPLLPGDTQTEVERMNPTVFPIMGLTLTSKSLSQTELWSLATYVLRPRLTRVAGVARVMVQGGRAPEWEADLKPEAMSNASLSATDVAAAIQASNIVHTVGRIDREYKQYSVVVDGQSKTIDDLKSTVIAERGGHPIRLSEVADVHPSMEDRTTIISANGSESVLLNVIRQPSANTVSVAQGVQDELRRLRPTLPTDVHVTTFYDQSILIRDAVDSVRDAVLIGAVLSVFVLMLFLRDIRATVVTATIIPITLLITFLLMRMAGLTLNLMTLGALAVGIGLIIDDAIVVVEAVFRNLTEGVSVPHAVQAASGQILAPMVSSTVTTVVVFVPLAFLQGVAGAFFAALAITLTMALLVSLALALAVSPSLCAGFLKYRKGLHDHGKVFNGVVRWYEGLLLALLKRKWVILPLMALTLIGTVIVGSRLESGFMPALDEGAFILDYLSPPGSSLEESDRLLRKVDGILLSTKEVSTFSRRTGTELGFSITESNRGDYAIMLKQGPRRRIEDVIGDVRGKVADQAQGLDVDFSQVLQDLIGDLAGNPNPIEVKVFGEDKKQIEDVAADLADRLGKVKGLADVKSGVVESGPELRFVPDAAKLGSLGLTPDQVSQQVNDSLFGAVATNVIVGDRQIPVRVRVPVDRRSDLDVVKMLPIQTAKGRVALGGLGSFALVDGTSQSNREDQRRLVAVTAGLEKIDLGTAVKEVRQAMAETKLPPGVTLTLAGQVLSQQESFSNLTLVLGASVLLVFTVMLFQFRSFTAPVVILLLMPLSLFGAVVALLVTQTALNVSSFMGVIMLAGIVVKNGILLLDRAQHSVEKGVGIHDSVVEAGKVRLRPILMTTMTAILGLVPLALGFGAGAEMQKPLATAVIGGLLFSTVLTLVFGPVLYAWVTGDRRTAAGKSQGL